MAKVSNCLILSAKHTDLCFNHVTVFNQSVTCIRLCDVMEKYNAQCLSALLTYQLNTLNTLEFYDHLKIGDMQQSKPNTRENGKVLCLFMMIKSHVYAGMF